MTDQRKHLGAAADYAGRSRILEYSMFLRRTDPDGWHERKLLSSPMPEIRHRPLLTPPRTTPRSNWNCRPSIEEKIRAQMSKKEKLIWVGRMSPRVARFSIFSTMIGGVVFGVILLVITLSMGTSMARQQKTVGPMVILSCFTLAVFGMTGIAAPLGVLIKSQHTCYVITNRRALVWRASWFGIGSHVDNYSPGQLQHMKRNDSWFVKGAGDLVFRTETTTHITTGRHGSHVSQSVKRFGFLGIEDVQHVENILRIRW